MTIKEMAEIRANELMEVPDCGFDTFQDAMDIALEEIIDECKSLMSC